MSNKLVIENFFYEQYDNLVRSVTGRVPNKADAEDIVMEAFTKALSNAEAFDPAKGDMKPWFNTLIRRATADWRKENRLQGMSTEVNEKNGGLIQDNSVSHRLSDQVIEDILGTKGKKKDILYRKFLMGLRNVDICSIMGMDKKAVSATICRFQQSIKDKYGELI